MQGMAALLQSMMGQTPEEEIPPYFLRRPGFGDVDTPPVGVRAPDNERPLEPVVSPVDVVGPSAVTGARGALARAMTRRPPAPLPSMPPPGPAVADDEIEALMAARYGPRLSQQPLPGPGGPPPPSLPPLNMHPASSTNPAGVGPVSGEPGALAKWAAMLQRHGMKGSDVFGADPQKLSWLKRGPFEAPPRPPGAAKTIPMRKRP